MGGKREVRPGFGDQLAVGERETDEAVTPWFVLAWVVGV